MAWLLPCRAVEGSNQQHSVASTGDEMVMEKLLSAGTLCAVVAIITALSDEAQRFVASVFSGDPLSGMALGGGGAYFVGNAVTMTLGTYAADYTLLAFFGLGGVVLLGLMLRT